MIPRTYPSTFQAVTGQQQMVVFVLPSIAGLTAWIDYIPVKQPAIITSYNTYDNDSALLVDVLASTTGKESWIDYIPVYVDAAYTTPWTTDAGGFIPCYPIGAAAVDALLLENGDALLLESGDLILLE
jgi:hypothetical protein